MEKLKRLVDSVGWEKVPISRTGALALLKHGSSCD
jgi:hypothetical protein